MIPRSDRHSRGDDAETAVGDRGQCVVRQAHEIRCCSPTSCPWLVITRFASYQPGFRSGNGTIVRLTPGPRLVVADGSRAPLRLYTVAPPPSLMTNCDARYLREPIVHGDDHVHRIIESEDVSRLVGFEFHLRHLRNRDVVKPGRSVDVLWKMARLPNVLV